jgi:molybdopterin converting factor small subunit
VRDAIIAVDVAYPGVAFRVLNGLDTKLEAGQTVSVVSAVAGG